MKRETVKRCVMSLAVIASVAVLLSYLWKIPYIFTAIGLAGWAFFGHLITADDDAPGGWSNPDGSLPFPWRELVIKGLVFASLCLLAMLVPGICTLGGAS